VERAPAKRIPALTPILLTSPAAAIPVVAIGPRRFSPTNSAAALWKIYVLSLTAGGVAFETCNLKTCNFEMGSICFTDLLNGVISPFFFCCTICSHRVGLIGLVGILFAI
jgi:hypothetical protein